MMREAVGVVCDIRPLDSVAGLELRTILTWSWCLGLVVLEDKILLFSGRPLVKRLFFFFNLMYLAHWSFMRNDLK